MGFIVRPESNNDSVIEAGGFLLGCPTAPAPPGGHDERANRPLLPPGIYDVVGVARVARRGEDHHEQLVSEPVRIQVLAASAT